MLEVTLGQHSLAGPGHARNQDFHGAVLPGAALRASKGVAVALADGIGSSAVGHVASAAAVRSFLDDYYLTPESWSVRRSAQRVLQATNSWLHAQTMRSEGRFDKDRGHVCTFSALVLKGRHAHLLHVGDSRIYQLHERSLEPLTQDHRLQLGATQACLARALGTGPAVEIDYHQWLLQPGDLYLLATDGAHDHLSAAVVHAALSRHGGDLQAAAQDLADGARAAGSTDDITVQLLRVEALPDTDAATARAAWQALPPAPELSPRQVLDHYTLVRPLHTGARSQVHLAHDDASGQPVALKFPSADTLADRTLLDRFLLEEWVARRIHSPHVLRPAADHGPRSHLYVAMEYLPGQTLAQWMRDHPRPGLAEVRAIVAQLGQGLQAFHRLEMLHQDLRPENVMIDASGTVKIIDFGTVQVAGLTECGPTPAASALVGTLQYAAPEYFVGQPADTRADLFSLAVLAYQMLSGQLPYGLQVTRLRDASGLRRLRYTPLRHHRPDLPAWLDAVLHKALQPQPARRQQAVSELLHDLDQPGPAFHRQRLPPLAQRHPVRFWQATSALLALVALLLLHALLQRGP